jgi:hypothetical protein
VESLQRDGYVLLDKVFCGEELAALCADVERVFEEVPPDERGNTPEESQPFRYEMLNRSNLVEPRIPYPVFAIAAHLYLWDCPIDAGPTGVIPGSHTSGQAPPPERLADETLEWAGRGMVPVLAEAGDVALFVSDIWHRRMPLGPHDPGRMFVQCHYGRRDMAQRIRPTSVVNHLSDEALARARTRRERTLVGIHPLGFYDG